MARVKIIRKTKRISSTKPHNMGTISNNRSQKVVSLKSDNGLNYFVKPKYKGKKLRPFQRACEVKTINQPPTGVEQTHRKPATDYVSLATKIAKVLYRKTSLDHIDEVAESLFTFDVEPHLHPMPDMVAQAIFNWIITLSKQPIAEEEKLRLVKKFIARLATASSPIKKPAT